MTSADQTLGFCQKAGRRTVGSKCVYKKAAPTGCIDGAVCMNVRTTHDPEYRCVKQCDLFAKKALVKPVRIAWKEAGVQTKQCYQAMLEKPAKVINSIEA